MYNIYLYEILFRNFSRGFNATLGASLASQFLPFVLATSSEVVHSIRSGSTAAFIRKPLHSIQFPQMIRLLPALLCLAATLLAQLTVEAVEVVAVEVVGR